jgi:hypothetical protein
MNYLTVIFNYAIKTNRCLGLRVLYWVLVFGVQGLGAEVVTVSMAELSSLRIQTVGIMQVGVWDLEFVFMGFSDW